MKRRSILAAFVASACLSACGGGGGGTATSVPASNASVTSYSPTHAAYGQSITLAGTGLSSITSLTVGGQAMTITTASDTSITAAIPAKATTGLLLATFANGSTITVGQFTVDPFGPPIVITQGGTYSGNWQSLDASKAAVTVRTTQAVTIQNCSMVSKGHLIDATAGGAHLVIRNCSGRGLDPLVANATRGDFLASYNIGGLIAENNLIEATGYGFRLWNGVPSWTPDGAIEIRFNQVKNLDGAPSDGNGGRILAGRASNPGDYGNSFVSAAALAIVNGLEIAWNVVQSDPGTSAMGDIIDLWKTHGVSQAPILIHDNYIHGGYPIKPSGTTYYAGAITTDGWSDDTPATSTAFVKIYNNQIVAHANVGINLAVGHDIEAWNNRIVSSGQFSDGSWYVGYAGIQLVSWDVVPRSLFYNVSAHDNVAGFQFEWAYPSNPNVFSPPIVRQDYLLTDCAGGASGPTSTCVNNQSLPGSISSATEAAELDLWKQKTTSGGIVIGPH